MDALTTYREAVATMATCRAQLATQSGLDAAETFRRYDRAQRTRDAAADELAAQGILPEEASAA
jgi:hypothetical protein